MHVCVYVSVFLSVSMCLCSVCVCVCVCFCLKKFFNKLEKKCTIFEIPLKLVTTYEEFIHYITHSMNNAVEKLMLVAVPFLHCHRHCKVCLGKLCQKYNCN